ncbi:hypothetical protein EDB86DRAFT_2814672, partial [Lactarius hatsudake]
LNIFGRYIRPTTVKNRCTTRRRREVIGLMIGEFGLCHVLFLLWGCFPGFDH